MYNIWGSISLMLQEANFMLRVRKLRVKESNEGQGWLLRRIGGNVLTGKFWSDSVVLLWITVTLFQRSILPIFIFCALQFLNLVIYLGFMSSFCWWFFFPSLTFFLPFSSLTFHCYNSTLQPTARISIIYIYKERYGYLGAFGKVKTVAKCPYQMRWVFHLL